MTAGVTVTAHVLATPQRVAVTVTVVGASTPAAETANEPPVVPVGIGAFAGTVKTDEEAVRLGAVPVAAIPVS
jgi:hypothetical protein